MMFIVCTEWALLHNSESHVKTQLRYSRSPVGSLIYLQKFPWSLAAQNLLVPSSPKDSISQQLACGSMMRFRIVCENTCFLPLLTCIDVSCLDAVLCTSYVVTVLRDQSRVLGEIFCAFNVVFAVANITFESFQFMYQAC